MAVLSKKKKLQGASATPQRRKVSRAEKSQLVKEAIFNAAVKVVGRVGYANAMVAMIASEAAVAQGTFYNYYESRQDLFDQLLPSLGKEMLKYIKEEASGSKSIIEREERSFRAFFTFLKMRPEFYRILYEAELFAPVAFKEHMDIVMEGYVKQLKVAAAKKELTIEDRDSVEALAYMLMGMRHYICMKYAQSDGGTTSLPEWTVRTYMAFVKNGIFRH